MPLGMITPPQAVFLDSLANSLNLTRLQKMDFISLRVGREVRFVDELSKSEASGIISELIEMKANKKVTNDEEDDFIADGESVDDDLPW